MSSSGCLVLGNGALISSIPTTYKMINEDESPKPNSLSSTFSASSSQLIRTLSADMSASTQKWLIHPSSSSSPMKRAQSSEQMVMLGEEDHDHGDDFTEVGNKNNEEKRGAFEDIWSSILSNKKNQFGSDPPYVHPLVKRSTSSLSEKSLEICTESLGSETGSDGFSHKEGSGEFQRDPHPQPDFHDPSAEYETTKEYNYMDDQVVGGRFNFNFRRAAPAPTKSVTSSTSKFPPPLPSLSHRNNLHMRSHRRDGRLVLEAVSTPSTICLRAHRCDGRLLLTLSSYPGDCYKDKDNYDDDKADNYPVRQDLQDEEDINDGDHNHHDEDDDDEGKESLAIEFVMDKSTSCRRIMSKLSGGKWRHPRNFNATVIKGLEEEEKDEAAPPLPRLILPKSTTLNAYEYYWRRSDSHHVKATAVAVLKQLAAAAREGSKPPQVMVRDENWNNKWVLGCNQKKIMAQAQKEENEVVVEMASTATTEHLVPFLRGCKDPRRPLLSWEAYCIATS